MKIFFAGLLTILSFSARSQQDTLTVKPAPISDTSMLHSLTVTASLGFVDPYRHNYSIPAGFEKSNTTGFAPVYLKLEYGISRTVGLAATLGYDVFNYNFNQLYAGYNGPIKRYKTSNLRIISGGITAFYHLHKVIHIRNLDPFVGIGIALNNIHYSAYPQSDSTLKVRNDHTATPYLKVGARYYFSNKCSIFGDIGYDKQSIFSLGFSCRFGLRHSKV